jgi:hypothetical protein
LHEFECFLAQAHCRLIELVGTACENAIVLALLLVIAIAGETMTADEVRALVETEIAGDWSRTNHHGCDLRRCLVEPVLRDYEDGSNPPQRLRLWLVLEETPEHSGGYKIVFNEESRMFGLVVPGRGHAVLIGYYGNFLETYAAM